MLEAGELVSGGDWNEDETLHLKDSHLLTNKKFVYACNVSEDMMDASQDDLKAIIGVTGENTQVVPVCAKLEEDMIEMSPEEKKEFLDDMGLITTGLDNLIKASYDALGLQYYFTAGEQEVRAWTVKK
jgi:ribosome-binding ATPase YchF (GTP1/OBG family)